MRFAWVLVGSCPVTHSNWVCGVFGESDKADKAKKVKEAAFPGFKYNLCYSPVDIESEVCKVCKGTTRLHYINHTPVEVGHPYAMLCLACHKGGFYNER